MVAWKFPFGEGLHLLDRTNVVPRSTPHGFIFPFEMGPRFGQHDGPTLGKMLY